MEQSNKSEMGLLSHWGSVFVYDDSCYDFKDIKDNCFLWVMRYNCVLKYKRCESLLSELSCLQ